MAAELMLIRGHAAESLSIEGAGQARQHTRCSRCVLFHCETPPGSP